MSKLQEAKNHALKREVAQTILELQHWELDGEIYQVEQLVIHSSTTKNGARVNVQVLQEIIREWQQSRPMVDEAADTVEDAESSPLNARDYLLATGDIIGALQLSQQETEVGSDQEPHRFIRFQDA